MDYDATTKGVVLTGEIMSFTTAIYQRFEHEIFSGKIFGFRNFVFGVTGDRDDYIREPLQKLGMEIVEGESNAVGEILEYLDGIRKNFSTMPKFLWGTPFQQRVWWKTYIVPYGETISYGELAGRIGEPKAARAVGNALGKNPLALIVPCHRVIRSDGGLGGFGGGIELKKRLLELEKTSISQNSVRNRESSVE